MRRMRYLTVFSAGIAAIGASAYMGACYVDDEHACVGVNEKDSCKYINSITVSSSGDTSGIGGYGGTGEAGGGGGVSASCGDAQLSGSEECDDGNLDSADGCNSECLFELCYACTGAPSVCTLQVGVACDEATYCDPKGQCVEHCLDTIKDSDETGVDCGGSTCKLCPGKICAQADECASGFCVDGLCCNAACDGQCLACNLPGKRGLCSDTPAGEDDPNSTQPCSGSQATCGVGTSCVNKKENGQACSVDNECASGACVLGSPSVCKQAAGTPCDSKDVCASNNCIDSLCAP